jgi:hypothetical protein
MSFRTHGPSLALLVLVASSLSAVVAVTGCSEVASNEAEDLAGELPQAYVRDGGALDGGALDNCDAVLERDLSVKANSVPPSKPAADVLRRHLRMLRPMASFSVYDMQYGRWKEANRTGTMLSLTTLRNERKLSYDEYEDLWQRFRFTGDPVDDAFGGLIDDYAAYVRYPQAQNDWNSCALRTRTPRILAYGMRLPNGQGAVELLLPKNTETTGPVLVHLDITAQTPTTLPAVTLAPGTTRNVEIGSDPTTMTVQVRSGGFPGDTATIRNVDPPKFSYVGYGPCDAAAVTSLHDSYWKAFGEDLRDSQLKAWCATRAVPFDELMRSHAWFLTTQDAGGLREEVVAAAFHYVFGAHYSPTEAQLAQARQAVLAGKTFDLLAADLAAIAREQGRTCVTAEWEGTSHSTIALCQVP